MLKNHRIIIIGNTDEKKSFLDNIMPERKSVGYTMATIGFRCHKSDEMEKLNNQVYDLSNLERFQLTLEKFINNANTVIVDTSKEGNHKWSKLVHNDLSVRVVSRENGLKLFRSINDNDFNLRLFYQTDQEKRGIATDMLIQIQND
ncbi:hypothetical protein L3V83_09410 [Thiotrichales bacterium 19X7-9]|nr:hypothetical protein [Thiotrichales bacterium 19X7-9]